MSERGPREDELGRLLAEGLRRDLDRPVDERAMVEGAWRGAARIRRRRRAGARLAVVVAVALPAGLLVGRWASDRQPPAVSSAVGAPAASRPVAPQPAAPQPVAPLAAAGAQAAAAPSSGVRAGALGAGGSAPGGSPLQRTTAGAVEIPASALLTAADAAAVTTTTFLPAADTGNATPPASPAAADVCGDAVGRLPIEAGGRSATFRPAAGTSPGGPFSSTVRVFAGGGAAAWVSTLARQACLTSVPIAGLDAALVGHGGADPQGRVHWFAVGSAGRTVTEIGFVAPRGAVRAVDVATLLGTAARRLAASGLPAAAAADPALR